MQILKPPARRLSAAVLSINLTAFRLPWMSWPIGGAIALWFWLFPCKGLQVLQAWQEAPPSWLLPPATGDSWQIFLPVGLLWGIAQLVMLISPKQKTWSRSILVGLVLLASLRYVLWRSLTTLNFADSLTSVVSLGLWLMEMVIIAGSSLQLVWLLRVKSRRLEADRAAQAVLARDYLPSIDILIPTFNEPVDILRRTIIGCQAIDYPRKEVYLLDDGERTEMEALCRELGCRYLARSEHSHAKAGNLNYGIDCTDGELIAVFDADFVPSQNFLERTAGFFQKPQIGLVQTHQCFYNADPIAYNLGLEKHLVPEVEIFSRFYQPLRDRTLTAICYGSSFVVRRSALESVGGFVRGTLSEDYHTAIELSVRGYQVIYTGERLSAGISPENMASHIRQRQRWARGTLQVLFIPSNPITIPGLSFLQRIAHFEGLLQWLSSTFRAVFLFLPIILATLDAVPLQSTLEEWLSFFLPFYLLTLSTFCWFSFRSRSALFSDVYNVIGCIPLTSVIIQTLIAPFTEPFRVTPKGQTPQRFSYNWRLAFPLFIALGAGWGLFYFHFLSPRASSPLGENIAGYQGILAILALYNMVVLCVALIGLIDVPKTPISETGYAIATPIALRASRGIYRGTTCKLAEKWVELELACPGELAGRVAIEFWEENFNLKGRIVWNRGNRYRIAFEPMAIAQYRRLVELIFCRPGRWQQADHPGELKTLWLLFSRLGYPFQLWWRSRRDFARFNPVSIAPVSIAENPHPSKR